MPFLQKGGKFRKDGTERSANTRAKPYWYIRVPTAAGYKALSTGTTDKKTAKRMEVMVDDLHRGANRDPELLGWLIDRALPPAERLKPLVLLNHYDNNTLDELRTEREARLNPPAPPVVEDVNEEVQPWYESVMTQSSKDHADRYLAATRTFVPEGEVVPPSKFIHRELLNWFNSLQKPESAQGRGLSANTARRYRVGLRSFIDHLVMCKRLEFNPLAAIKPPKKVLPRDRHLTSTNAIRLIEAFADSENAALQAVVRRHRLQIADLQGFNALLCGAGVEVSVALGLTVGNVRLKEQEVFAPGTKTYNRRRVVRVAEWAWPWIEALARGRASHERLFASIGDRWIAADAFNAVISALISAEPQTFTDYWMRDGRHTYAVRAIKAGTPPKVVATQLGHKDARMVHEVYGVYEPNAVERAYWEKAAAARDRRDEGVQTPRPGGGRPAVSPRVEAPPPNRQNAGHAARIPWPAVEELLARLAGQSVSAVAKELGVSDQAVRKHLKRHGVTQIPDGRRAGVSAPRAQRANGEQ